MDIYVLDSEFNVVGLVDSADSVIWNKRYIDVGDFEIYIRADTKLFDLFRIGKYVKRLNDDMVCIIETIELSTDEEDGNYITVTGRDLKALLSRRIVWEQTTVTGTLDTCVTKLLNENIISPEYEDRAIPNFSIQKTTFTNEAKFNVQFTGENLLDAIQTLCRAVDCGFKVTLTSDKKIVFGLYNGNDYTSGGGKRIVFSPDFENLYDTTYTFSRSNYANVALVAGEGEGKDRKRAEATRLGEIYDPETVGVERCEIFVDARNVSSNDGEINIYDYENLLLNAGVDKLRECEKSENFEGDIVSKISYRYKYDYDVGDIVIAENEYKIRAQSRIVAVMECEDENGYNVTPTFEKWRLE